MYAIIEKRFFYAPQPDVRGLLTDPMGQPEIFADKAAAKAVIEELDGEVYRLSHNESGRPAYTVRHVDRLARHFREEIARAA